MICDIIFCMNLLDALTVTIVLDASSVFILSITLFHFVLSKKSNEFSIRILSAAMGATVISSISDIIHDMLEQTPNLLWIRDYPVSFLVITGLHAGRFFLAEYLACQIGYEEKIRRHFRVLLIPLLLDIISVFAFQALGYTIVNILPRIFFIIINFFFLIFTITAYIFIWKIDKMLLILPVMLFAIEIYLGYALSKVSISTFILAITILYLYLSLTKKMVLIHLGGIILTLCIMTTLVVGNMITSSAFVSYLKTIHDRNDSHLSDVIAYMEQFESLPWLMNYWINNADVITFDLATTADDQEESLRNLAKITSDQAKQLTPEQQEIFAEHCYNRIAEYFEKEFLIHNLDDLFLIIPDDTDKALIIFDAEKNPDGTYRLGQFRDIEEEKLEWVNYNTVINDNTTWTWGQYTNNEDFGFYRELTFNGEAPTAFLCNSFDRKEVYAHLEFISSSRERALRELTLSTLLILLSLYLMLLKPLGRISNVAKRYEINKNSKEVESELSKIHIQNEIGTFAEEFTSLAKEMDRYTTQVALLAGEKERASTELRMAYDIQASALPSFFPAFPDRNDFDIYAGMKPAKMVGGDFYDFFLVDETHLAFLIADVSEKGVPAALFMMSAKNLISYRAHEGGTPGEILTSICPHICQNNSSMMFVTVWLGILDLASGLLKYSCAGHEPPAVKNGNAPYILMNDEEHGMIMGLKEDAKYKDSEIQLAPGSVVFIYTDGVTDAQNPSEEMYGIDRMLSCLNQSASDIPQDIIKKMYSDIEDYVGSSEQSDDITMLAVKYNP
ncbi:MAG: PP2C family protein-serine/threonine phosphatase [Lachnospiraceae bacterium]|nr:PP2C family protein-serine/threonine phosphatase [Lachnospiraceae bacterium]